MSSVRMCDNCGTIFSELEEGWTTAEVAQISDELDPYGNRKKITVVHDQCPDCSPQNIAGKLADARREGKRLRALTAGIAASGKAGIREVDAGTYADYLRYLEKQNGIGSD